MIFYLKKKKILLLCLYYTAKHLYVHEDQVGLQKALKLQFSFLPPEATLANVLEVNSPTLARENKIRFGGRRISTRNNPILKMKKLRLRKVKKFA